MGKVGQDPVLVKTYGKLLVKNHQFRSLLAACNVSKIEPSISLYELRHTYASMLAQLGVELLTIAKLLGHVGLLADITLIFVTKP